jgi:asparagine synthase (glutamine-hydrolysing)
MCGIAGAVATSAVSRNVVQAQLRSLDHRGPDSSGIYAKDGAIIGQTRLAVIDVAGGDPPITSEDGSVGVALNGEIYNYRALGDSLRKTGHVMSTHCDTEVIAHLAEDVEPVALARRLEGMFAFAVWDDRRRRLVVGRDRMGKKPVYYWTGAGALVFGSEIKAVLAHPLVARELDPEAIPDYFAFGYVPTPRTFFAGIRSLPPGHVLTMEPGGEPQIERYWAPPIPGVDGVEGLDLSLDEAADEVLRLLTAAVRRRMIADVPLGAFLSGGLDSSTVVALMAQAGSRPVRTFTIGFDDEEGFDERPYARLVAERFGTDHVEFVVNPNAVDLLERLVWHHDQPFGDSSAVPTFLLSELTRSHVTVALCGDGGDELFAGYERFAAALLLERFQHLPTQVGRIATSATSLIPPRLLGRRAASLRRFTACANATIPDALLTWAGPVDAHWRTELLGRATSRGVDEYHRLWNHSRSAGTLDRLLALNLGTYLVDDLLPKVDRMSMAHGLEVRSPLLDRELAEFALRLPATTRIRGTKGKLVLKRAARRLLPDEIVTRRKRGFGVPLERWFRTDLRGYLDQTLRTPAARIRAFVKPEALDGLLSEHESGRANHRDALWALLTLELFLRREGW